MKRLILILLASVFSLFAEAQNADTTYFELKEQIVEMQNEIDIMQKDYGRKINNIKIDMTNFNKQFRRGTNVMFVGVVYSIGAALLANYNPEPKHTQTKNLITGLAIGGAAFRSEARRTTNTDLNTRNTGRSPYDGPTRHVLQDKSGEHGARQV